MFLSSAKCIATRKGLVLRGCAYDMGQNIQECTK